MLYDLLEWNYLNRYQGLSRRLNYLSAAFLGKPYAPGALGEGEFGEFDQNPQYGCDAFDCLTYVNSVLALLHAFNLTEFRHHLALLNYRSGLVKYQYRHHFMSVDWNPANAHRGYLRDMTADIKSTDGYALCDYAATYIDKANWFKRRSLADLKFRTPIDDAALKEKLACMHNLSENMQGVQACTPYLPLDKLFYKNDIPIEIKVQFPNVALIEIVRPNWDLRASIGTHLNISHIGFLLQPKGELIFRHASEEQQCIIEQPLEEYLRRFLSHPTVKGINVQQIYSH